MGRLEQRAWLFLRGLARDSRHWGDFSSRFEQKMAAQVLCLDLPGMGEAQEKASPWHISAITDQVRARYQPHCGKKTWSVLAISLGGMVALDWLSRYPNDFKSAVIICASAADLSPFYHRFSPTLLPAFSRAILLGSRLGFEKAILASTTRLLSNSESIAAEWAGLSRHTRRYIYSTAAQLVAASRFRSPASLVTPPLFLSSRADAMVDWSCSQKLAQKYQAALVMHAKAGHDLPLDDPEWVMKSILDYEETLAAKSR